MHAYRAFLANIRFENQSEFVRMLLLVHILLIYGANVEITVFTDVKFIDEMNPFAYTGIYARDKSIC